MHSTWQTIDFLLTARPDAAGAKCLFRKAFHAPGNPSPRVVNVDDQSAYPEAVEALKAEEIVPCRARLRQMQVPEQHGRARSQDREEAVWLAKGYGSFQRVEDVTGNRNDAHKGRVRWLANGDSAGQGHFVARLFGIAA